MLFDRNQLRFAAAWTGGFLNHSSRRFGLLNTPTPNGQDGVQTSSLAGWADEKGNFESTYPPTAPLPKEWAKFKGLYLMANRRSSCVLSSAACGRSGIALADATDIGVIFRGHSRSARPIENLRCLVAELPDGHRVLSEKGFTLHKRGEPGRFPWIVGIETRHHSRRGCRIGLVLTSPPSESHGGLTSVVGPASRTDVMQLACAGANQEAGESTSNSKGRPRPLDQAHHHPTRTRQGHRRPVRRRHAHRSPTRTPGTALFFCHRRRLPAGRPHRRLHRPRRRLDLSRRRRCNKLDLEAVRHRAVPAARAEGRRRQDRRPRTRPTHAAARPERRRRGRLLREPQQRLAHRRRRALVRHLPGDRPGRQLLLLQDRRRPHCRTGGCLLQVSKDGSKIGGLRHRLPPPDRPGHFAGRES